MYMSHATYVWMSHDTHLVEDRGCHDIAGCVAHMKLISIGWYELIWGWYQLIWLGLIWVDMIWRVMSRVNKSCYTCKWDMSRSCGRRQAGAMIQRVVHVYAALIFIHVYISLFICIHTHPCYWHVAVMIQRVVSHIWNTYHLNGACHM